MTSRDEEKAARLAAALRANLKRRKAQARQREAPLAPAPGDSADPAGPSSGDD